MYMVHMVWTKSVVILLYSILFVKRYFYTILTFYYKL